MATMLNDTLPLSRPRALVTHNRCAQIQYARLCSTACTHSVQCAAARREMLSLLAATLPANAALELLAAVMPNAAHSATEAPAKDPTFYARWPYATPADIIPYIEAEAVRGDAQSVLDAMDAFSLYYPQYKIGPEKGALFEQALQQAKPSLALELGTFLGYSAIRTARNLAPGGRLICVEANPDNAAVARQLLEYAGVLEGQVLVVEGLAKKVIPGLPALLQQLQQQQLGQNAALQQDQDIQQQQQQQQGLGFDAVFLDHSKNDYLPDLQRLEQLALVRQGSTVLADNVVYPGAPGFLEYLDNSGRYNTQLLKAKYEYEQAWNPDWEPNKDDAMSVSVCLGGEL
ncbi:S-adenosyl-L-methionine-dependent methyltransferase [Scenedesmus sp. NREL 46B-D3]|nr:S-adenosyl-L-methionine-dependent methyltransferase [Scenedesmus sp. NREL 46B-D3]